MEVLKTYSNFIVINNEHNCYLCPDGYMEPLDDLYCGHLFISERGAKMSLSKAKNRYKKSIQASEKRIASIKDGTEKFFTVEAITRFEEDLKIYNDKLSILEASEIREVSVDIKFNIK